MRREYRLTENQMARVLEAMKSDDPVREASIVWRDLGEEMGFQPTSVQAARGKMARCFIALPKPIPSRLPLIDRDRKSYCGNCGSTNLVLMLNNEIHCQDCEKVDMSLVSSLAGGK